MDKKKFKETFKINDKIFDPSNKKVKFYEILGIGEDYIFVICDKNIEQLIKIESVDWLPYLDEKKDLSNLFPVVSIEYYENGSKQASISLMDQETFDYDSKSNNDDFELITLEEAIKRGLHSNYKLKF